MPVTAWRRLSREQRRAWSVIAGVVVGGSLIKAAYFNLSRGLIVKDTERQQQESYAHLEEAQQFAQWSQHDRESRLPPLTPEQQAQMGQYLRLVEAHGWNKALELQGKEKCSGEGCPFLYQQGKKNKEDVPT